MQIKLTKNMDLENFTFLEGFPGIGLVGAMSISYIIEKLEFESIGYVESDKFPPLMSIHEGNPMPSIRVYATSKYKLATIFSEFSIPIEVTYELADALIEFIKNQKISKIISIAGIPTLKHGQNEDDDNDKNKKDNAEIYLVSSKKELKENIENKEIKPVEEGISSGINALLMLKAMENKIDDINILIPINPTIIDPKYAENAIHGINKLLNLNINTDELDKEAKEVESRIKTLIKKSRESHNQYKESDQLDDMGNPMYV